jgi:hypothetical protein
MSRGQKDLFNTVLACVTVAGGFSLWSMISHRPKFQARLAAMLPSIPTNVDSLCTRSIFPTDGSPHNEDGTGGGLCVRRSPGSLECCPGSTDRLRRVHQTAPRSARTRSTRRILRSARLAPSTCARDGLHIRSPQEVVIASKLATDRSERHRHPWDVA